MALPQNPYIAGNPVGGDIAFVGRSDILRDVTRILVNSHTNAIVLFGQRRIGKTSILQHLTTQLPHEGAYHPVYFDLQDKAVWSLEQVLQNLANEISHSLSLPEPNQVDFSQDDAFRHVFVPKILDILSPDKSLVLLFDEFDVLDNPHENQAGASFFPYLRKLMEFDRQRLQFIFVIGRKPDDLDILTLSVFKGVRLKRVSLLNRDDTAHLIHLSQNNGTLTWTQEAVEEISVLTNGHPYLTQQLCAIIWDQAYQDNPDHLPTITPVNVQAAIPEAIESSASALEWLWSGLASAERIVASVLAQAGPRTIDQTELEPLLVESGVRIVIGELRIAPQILMDWDLIEPVESGYRFRVELLRRWISEKKPVSRVQKELDRIQPLADNLYQAGHAFYQNGQLDDAINDLQRSLAINPNHLQSGLLLAQIYLEQQNANHAVSLLATIYEYNPGAARPRLVQALFEQAKEVTTEEEKLSIYDRILILMPAQPEVIEKRKAIWKGRGDQAHIEGRLADAIKAYEMAGLKDKAAEVEQQFRVQEFIYLKTEAENLEDQKQYHKALERIEQLETRFPNDGDWEQTKIRLEEKLKLADIYDEALVALEQGKKRVARKLLAQVIVLDPDHVAAMGHLTVLGESGLQRFISVPILIGIAVTTILLLLGGGFGINQFYLKPRDAYQQAELTSQAIAANATITAQAATAQAVMEELGAIEATGTAVADIANATATALMVNQDLNNAEKEATVTVLANQISAVEATSMVIAATATAEKATIEANKETIAATTTSEIACINNATLYSLEVVSGPAFEPELGSVYENLVDMPGKVKATWTVNNTGQCPWRDVSMQLSSGVQTKIPTLYQGEEEVFVVPPNKQVEVTISFSREEVPEINQDWVLVTNGISLNTLLRLSLRGEKWVTLLPTATPPIAPTLVSTPIPIVPVTNIVPVLNNSGKPSDELHFNSGNPGRRFFVELTEPDTNGYNYYYYSGDLQIMIESTEATQINLGRLLFDGYIYVWNYQPISSGEKRPLPKPEIDWFNWTYCGSNYYRGYKEACRLSIEIYYDNAERKPIDFKVTLLPVHDTELVPAKVMIRYDVESNTISSRPQ